MRERVCKNCGGRQYKIVGQNMLKCSFCGTIYVDELASKEEEVLLVGANEALRETRFDEALSQFEKIINLFPRSFEGYFGKALSKNKIVLYNNSKGTKKTPRFFKSPQPLTNDEDFKKALELAPAEVQKDYLDIANKVDKIINNFSQEQYDIVVCEEDNENLENIFQSLKTNYKVYFTKKEREENSFSAISSCKLFIYITKEGKNFYRGEIKNFFDRFMYFVSLKEKLKSGFFILSHFPGDVHSHLQRSGRQTKRGACRAFGSAGAPRGRPLVWLFAQCRRAGAAPRRPPRKRAVWLK